MFKRNIIIIIHNMWCARKTSMPWVHCCAVCRAIIYMCDDDDVAFYFRILDCVSCSKHPTPDAYTNAPFSVWSTCHAIINSICTTLTDADTIVCICFLFIPLNYFIVMIAFVHATAPHIVHSLANVNELRPWIIIIIIIIRKAWCCTAFIILRF